MKSITSQYETHIAAKGASTLCSIILIQRTDSTQYAFTDFDSSIEVDGIIYLPSNSFIPTDFQTSATLSVDNLDITGIISEIDDVTEGDIYREYFYNAKIWVSRVNYNAPDDGREKILYGSLGEMTLQENKYLVEFRNLTYVLTKNLADVFSKTCRVELGSTKCGVSLDPSTWVGNTEYCAGDIVGPITYNGRRFIATTAGTSNPAEPAWNTTIDGTTNDGTVVWTTKDGYSKEGTMGVGTKIRFHTDWIGTINNYTTYFREVKFFNENDARVYPSSCSSNFSYYTTNDCSKLSDNNDTTFMAGGGSQTDIYVDFNFSTSFVFKSFEIVLDPIGENYTYLKEFSFSYTPDSGATWIPMYTLPAQGYQWWQSQGSVYADSDIYINNTVIYLESGIFADMDYLQDGVLTWLTGDNAGDSVEIVHYKSTTGVITIFQPPKFPIKTTDTYSVKSGCNHLFLGSDGTTATGDCVTRYNNGINFRGEPHVPTEDVLVGGIGETNKQAYVS